MIGRHPSVSVILGILTILNLVDAGRDGQFRRALVYFTGLGLGVVITDLTFQRRPPINGPLPVRRPKLELAGALASLLIGFGWLVCRNNGWFQIESEGLFSLIVLVLSSGSASYLMLAV